MGDVEEKLFLKCEHQKMALETIWCQKLLSRALRNKEILMIQDLATCPCDGCCDGSDFAPVTIEPRAPAPREAFIYMIYERACSELFEV
jgi:hypothetical protein